MNYKIEGRLDKMEKMEKMDEAPRKRGRSSLDGGTEGHVDLLMQDVMSRAMTQCAWRAANMPSPRRPSAGYGSSWGPGSCTSG